MNSPMVSRRNFGARFAAIASGLGIARLVSPGAVAAKESSVVKKLTYEGKPADGKQMITPLVIHKDLIYIAGQGAHSHDKGEQFPMDIENHTTHVLDSVKLLVEAGGGSMDTVLMLTVYLAKIDDYDGMNKVFKTYFPNGGPARTTVAVAALPGNSLVEINCIAAIAHK